MNYKAHIAELNLPYPEAPVFFMKPDSSILKGNKVFFIPGKAANAGGVATSAPWL